MTRPSTEPAVVTSVLDRLLDDDPRATVESTRPSRPVLRDLEAAIRRDLRWLVRTRRRVISWPKDYEELESSVLNYGVPDMTGANLASQEARAEFIRTIEAVIRRFDKRFKSVSVVPGAEGEPLDRTLRVRIQGVLFAEPAPETVTFDSFVEPDTHSLEIRP